MCYPRRIPSSCSADRTAISRYCRMFIRLEHTLTPLENRTRRIIGYLLLLHEISGTVRSADALGTANHKQNILSGITRHDMQNPFSLIGNLELSKDSFGDAAKTSGYILPDIGYGWRSIGVHPSNPLSLSWWSLLRNHQEKNSGNIPHHRPSGSPDPPPNHPPAARPQGTSCAQLIPLAFFAIPGGRKTIRPFYGQKSGLIVPFLCD